MTDDPNRTTSQRTRIRELEARVEELEDAAGAFLIEAERFFDFANAHDTTADFDREVPGGLTDLNITLNHLREVLADGDLGGSKHTNEEVAHLRDRLMIILDKSAIAVEKDISNPTQAFKQIREVAYNALDGAEDGSDQKFPTLLGFGPDDIKDLEADRDRLWDALDSIDAEIRDSRLTMSEKIRRVKSVLNRELHSSVPTRPNDCDHEWVTESRQVRASRSPGHPAGAAPPEYEQSDVICKKCGVSREADHD